MTKRVGDIDVHIAIDSEFPWDGQVEVKVQAEHSDFILALRLPDWCESYQLNDPDSLWIREQDGYLYLKKNWGKEDRIKINFPMKAKLILARTQVREDIGKAAVMRGPMIYCLEEVDNGKDLHLLSINADTKLRVLEQSICGEMVRTIQAEGLRQKPTIESVALYHEYAAPEYDNISLQYVPYYMWANRGENEMQVWTRIND